MAAFNPEMLVIARESRDYSQTEFAKLIRIQQGTLSKIEGRLLPPSEDLIQSISDILNLPIEFFYQTERVYGFNSTVYFHRKRQSLSEKTLRRLHAQMNITRMRIARLLRSVELPPCKFHRFDP